MTHPHADGEKLLDCEIASTAGNERTAIDRLERVLAGRDVDVGPAARLRTAVAEATMNAIEHGNRNDPGLTVRLQVVAHPTAVVVRISDHGHGPEGPPAEEPDLDAKLAGLQDPRGWGLFLIRNMVDDLRVVDADGIHTVELTVAIEGRP